MRTELTQREYERSKNRMIFTPTRRFTIAGILVCLAITLMIAFAVGYAHGIIGLARDTARCAWYLDMYHLRFMYGPAVLTV